MRAPAVLPLRLLLALIVFEVLVAGGAIAVPSIPEKLGPDPTTKQTEPGPGSGSAEPPWSPTPPQDLLEPDDTDPNDDFEEADEEPLDDSTQGEEAFEGSSDEIEDLEEEAASDMVPPGAGPPSAPSPPSAPPLPDDLPVGPNAVFEFRLGPLEPPGIPEPPGCSEDPSSTADETWVTAGPVDPVLPAGRDACGAGGPNDSGGDAPIVPLANAILPRSVPVLLWESLAALSLAVLLARFLWMEFTRIEPEKVLNHPSRSAIVEFVREHPGADLSFLVRALGMNRSSARRHVATLQRCGQLATKRLHGRTSLFLPGQAPPREHPRMALLRRAPFLRTYELLVRSPAVDQATIGQQLGISRQRTAVILRRLEQASLARADQSGARRVYFPL